jgi:hypothetical protein
LLEATLLLQTHHLLQLNMNVRHPCQTPVALESSMQDPMVAVASVMLLFVEDRVEARALALVVVYWAPAMEKCHQDLAQGHLRPSPASNCPLQ